MKRLTVVITAATLASACGANDLDRLRDTFAADAGGMAVLSVSVSDNCQPSPPRRVAAWSVWVDGTRSHELLLFPAAGQPGAETLVGPLTNGRHTVELRPSDLWKPVDCLSIKGVDATVYGTATPEHAVYRHAPILELRADTIGEETDLPLYAYAERLDGNDDVGWRYTVVFSNEDGGTPTRALFARWGRTTDIEQVYEFTARDGRVGREVIQGPDHVTRAFSGRRRGEAPVLLVATLNNMVIDRGRSLAAVRPVPAVVDLSRATRESTMDARPWAFRVMRDELAAEGRIVADAPLDEQWPRVAPDPLSHVFLEARLRVERALAVAWVTDRAGRRFWSHYGKMPLAIERDGWVRSAVAVGADPAASIAALGWACLAAPDAKPGGTCEIEATRAFAFGDDFRPGRNLVAPARLMLPAGGEARLGSAAPRAF